MDPKQNHPFRKAGMLPAAEHAFTIYIHDLILSTIVVELLPNLKVEISYAQIQAKEKAERKIKIH